MTIFDDHESEVRSYCRAWPAVFDTASGSRLRDDRGREYLDFFAGAGTLNYGHNPPALRAPLLRHLERDGITHGLDMHTTAKADLLGALHDIVLRPRGLDLRVQFPGPTGTNAVEAAIKLARKVTGRTGIVGFTGGFHGMTLGSLAITGNLAKRRGAGVPLTHSTVMPYDGYLGDGPTPAGDVGSPWFRRLLEDPGSGFERPAAVVVETVQGEGGIHVARDAWLRDLAALCRRHGILLIVDDVQMGVGRTGPFFSFETAGIEPDIVCLSKSISGYGLPMALVLLRPEHDQWGPGEHNGTFRGHTPAFVTAAAALREYWTDDTLERGTLAKGERVDEVLGRLARELGDPAVASARGRGLARGLSLAETGLAGAAAAAAFRRGLLVETAGPRDEVLKLLPPLTISEADLDAGLDIVTDAVREAAGTGAASLPVTA